VHDGSAQDLVPADNIVVGFSSHSARVLADTDCSNVHGTFTISGDRLLFADLGSLGSSIALIETPTLPGSCFDPPRRQRAERLDAFFERGPTVEIRPGFLVLREQSSTLVLAER
jgi:hypothetical protein